MTLGSEAQLRAADAGTSAPSGGRASPAFDDFALAAEGVLAHLASTLPLTAWVVARVDAADAVVLAACGGGGELVAGATFPWAGSISARMVAGLGPRVVPALDAAPAYRDAPVVREGRLGAYLGVPLCRPDGTLFGVIAGGAAHPVTPALDDALGLVELLARLLGGLLAAGIRVATDDRAHDRAEAREVHDPVTGLGHRAHWDQVLVAEESRCRRYGDRASIVRVELEDYEVSEDDAGPGPAQILLRRAARVLRTVCREEDLVARVAPDAFAVLSVGADTDGAAAFVARLEQGLAANDVRATIRVGVRDPRLGLHAAWRLLTESRPAQRRPA